MNFKIKHKKLLALLFCTTFLFYGCTSSEISEKQLEIDNLKEEVNRLSGELKETKEKLENISIDDVLLRDKLKIEDDFSWMRNKDWDNIVIAPCDSDANYVFVNDKEILSAMNDFLYIKREVEMPPSGFHSEVTRYLYTFIDGDKQYDVSIEARGIININGRYFETNPYIHKLGDAFIKGETWRKAGNIETKIANSGLIFTDMGPRFDSWRIQLLAREISKGKLIEKPLKQDVDPTIYKAYYFGDEIIINAYPKYLNIIDKDKEYWYEIEDAKFMIHSILNGIG